MTAEERRTGFMALKVIIKKLQIHLQLSYSRRVKASGLKTDGRIKATELLPEDVKEGEFAVFAANSETPQRFVVGLRFLSNPSFFKTKTGRRGIWIRSGRCSGSPMPT